MQVNALSFPFPWVSTHSMSVAAQWMQIGRGGTKTVPHFLHFDPMILSSLRNCEGNIGERSVGHRHLLSRMVKVQVPPQPPRLWAAPMCRLLFGTLSCPASPPSCFQTSKSWPTPVAPTGAPCT